MTISIFKKSISINLIMLLFMIKLSLLCNGAYCAQLPAKTPVKLASAEYITTQDDVYVGAMLDFVVAKDVVLDGITFIKKGTPAKGKVYFVEENAMKGQPAEIVIQDFTINTFDNTKIKLVGSMYKSGTNHSKWVIPLAYAGGWFLLIPLFAFLLVKGGEANIPIGYEQLLYTAENVNLEL